MTRIKKIRNAAVIAVVSLVAFLYCNGGLFKAKASRSWPSTKGTIITSEIDSSSIQFGKSNRASFYTFDAHYQYGVDGAQYTSDRVSFMSNYISKKIKSEIQNKYKEGNKVDVFYNPDAPAEAVLMTGINKYNRSPLYHFSRLLLCFGIVALIVYGANYIKRGND